MKPTALLLLIVMTDCHRDEELNASEAIAAGDALIAKNIPTLKHHTLDANAQLRDGKWRIEYGGGCGSITVEVDSHTGQAREIAAAQ